MFETELEDIDKLLSQWLGNHSEDETAQFLSSFAHINYVFALWIVQAYLIKQEYKELAYICEDSTLDSSCL